MVESFSVDIRQMGITHRDFFRLLPRAMGNNAYHIHESTVEAILPTGAVTIIIGEEQERKLSPLVIMPYADVRFEYRGVPDDVRENFEHFFHMRYMRGLG